MHHRRFTFEVLIQGYSGIALTPSPSIRKTRSLPRRGYVTLHNGLVSSPSEHSEESTCETGRPSSPQPSPSRNTEDAPQTKQFYSLPSTSPLEVGVIRVVCTRIKDAKPSRTLVGPLDTFGPQIWIALGVGRVAH